METLNGFLFLIIIALQIISLIPIKQEKIKKTKTFIPFVALFPYILYESYFLQPEISINVPIRIDLLLLHPAIIAAFIVNIIRSIKMIKNKETIGILSLLTLLGSFIYWWYYIIVVCMFYQQ